MDTQPPVAGGGAAGTDQALRVDHRQLSSAFSSICFGIGLAYMGERILTTYYLAPLWLVLAAFGFIKLVDSWWWYFYVLEQTDPTRRLSHWYANFAFVLTLFAVMGLADRPGWWCLALAVCNFIGCQRVSYAANHSRYKERKREIAAGQMLARFGTAASLALVCAGVVSLVGYSFADKVVFAVGLIFTLLHLSITITAARRVGTGPA